MRDGTAGTVALVACALIAFAGNSLLCRAALASGASDPATFTLVRLASGALVLAALVRVSGPRPRPRGLPARPLALFLYAACFSWAYVRIPAGVGALVLFACVQLTMIGWALRDGTGPRGLQWAGIALALGGLAWLLLPGASAPDALGTALMASSGCAWGAYTLLGRRGGAPLARTADAFTRATPLALVAFAISAATGLVRADARGIALAAASGAVTSGLGYAAWYAVLPRLQATRAAVLQLSVPVLAMVGAVALLSEPVGDRLLAAGAMVLLGIALTIGRRR